jgi:hypothetical protein
MTGSREWMMQCASATVIGAFAVSIWLVGQVFIQRSAGGLAGRDLFAAPVPSCSRLASPGEDRETAARQFRSCVMARR